MRHYRQTTSFLLTSQALCFCLLLQGSGIAQALPLPPKKIYVSQGELEARLAGSPSSESDKALAGEDGSPKRIFGRAWSSAGAAGSAVKRWLSDPWGPAPPAEIASLVHPAARRSEPGLAP